MRVGGTPGRPTRSAARARAALLAIALVVVGALAADLLMSASPAASPTFVAQDPAEAGGWYCPVTTGDQEPAVVSVAAVGDRPARVSVARYRDGRPTPDPPVAVVPGETLEVAPGPGGGPQPVAVRWQEGPAVATWRTEGPQSAGAPCQAAPSATWHLAGFDTRLGATSTLHLFNPFAEDAVATVTFGTPEGRKTLVRTESVVVAAGQLTKLALNDLQPEVPDLGVNVEVLAGRLVAQGEVRFDPPGDDPGLSGRTLLPAAPAPSLAWSFGFARADDDASSWLEILNPGDHEAAVRLQVSDPRDGGAALDDEISVPAGGVVRVDLAEASAQPDFGVAVTGVNDTPVVVSRFTAVRTSSGSGVAASLGGREPATRWALVGGGAGGRSGGISVYNPGPQPVAVDVLAAGAPPSWSGIQIPANGRAAVELADAGAGRTPISAVVRASGPVVAELRSVSQGDASRLWTAVGAPSGDWTGPPLRPAVRHDPSLSVLPMPSQPPEPLEPVAGTPPA